jgi:hypothetical protein
MGRFSNLFSKSNTNIEHKCCGESYWTSLIRGLQLYHGDCTKQIENVNNVPTCIEAPQINIENYNTNTFTKTFAFWKIYLIFFFLLVIGIANLISNKDKSLEYINNQNTYANFIYEFILLFVAFLLSTIFMYLIRIGGKAPIKTYFMSTLVIFVFCIFKHFAFEFSGLYRFNFGSKECKKEHFGSSETTKSTDHADSTAHTNCKCDDGMFSGLFWNGLGYQGIIITFILIVFFGISIVKPDLTEKFFNYKFNLIISLLCLFFIVALLFIGGFIINGNVIEDKICSDEDNIFTKIKKECALRDKKCKNENDIFTRVKDGCAVVSIIFMVIITFLMLPILFSHMLGWAFGKEETVTLSTNKTSKIYNDCFYKSSTFRFGLTLIESLVIFLIFALAEAGIEALRKGEKIDEILLSWHFWEKSLMVTLPGIVVVQFLLEYSNWFKEHLFNDKKYQSTCYSNIPQGVSHHGNPNSIPIPEPE